MDGSTTSMRACGAVPVLERDRVVSRGITTKADMIVAGEIERACGANVN